MRGNPHSTERRLASWTLLATAAALVIGIAAGPVWKFLGERWVKDSLDHDVITVTATQGDFRALKLLVKGHAVHFLDAKVHFANGTSQDLSIRAVIPAGGQTRLLDLVGTERVIQRVEFWYEANSVGHGGARIRLYGIR